MTKRKKKDGAMKNVIQVEAQGGKKAKDWAS